jgi:quinoprotein glucose dehydrogenase
VRKYFLVIFFLFFSSVSYSDDYSLTEITKLDEPWGSAFISNDEIIVTEKDGKIKIVNINSKNTFELIIT